MIEDYHPLRMNPSETLIQTEKHQKYDVYRVWHSRKACGLLAGSDQCRKIVEHNQRLYAIGYIQADSGSILELTFETPGTILQATRQIPLFVSISKREFGQLDPVEDEIGCGKPVAQATQSTSRQFIFCLQVEIERVNLDWNLALWGLQCNRLGTGEKK